MVFDPFLGVDSIPLVAVVAAEGIVQVAVAAGNSHYLVARVGYIGLT
jgi:hypothetical protein